MNIPNEPIKTTFYVGDKISDIIGFHEYLDMPINVGEWYTPKHIYIKIKGKFLLVSGIINLFSPKSLVRAINKGSVYKALPIVVEPKKPVYRFDYPELTPLINILMRVNVKTKKKRKLQR